MRRSILEMVRQGELEPEEALSRLAELDDGRAGPVEGEQPGEPGGDPAPEGTERAERAERSERAERRAARDRTAQRRFAQQARRARFHEERSGLDEHRRDLDRQRRDLDRQRADLDRQRADLDLRRAELDAQRASLEAQRDRLQDALADSSEETRGRFEQQLDRLDQQYDHLDQEGDRIDREGDLIDEQAARIDEQGERLDERREQLDEVQEQLDEALEEMDEAFEELGTEFWDPGEPHSGGPSDEVGPDFSWGAPDPADLKKRLKRVGARLRKVALTRALNEMEAAVARESQAWARGSRPEAWGHGPRPEAWGHGPRPEAWGHGPRPEATPEPSPPVASPLRVEARIDSGGTIELEGDPDVALVEVDDPNTYSISELGDTALVRGGSSDEARLRFNPQADLDLVLNGPDAQITGLTGAIRATCNVGELLLRARIHRGESELDVNAGTVRIELATGSDVRIINRSNGQLSLTEPVRDMGRGVCVVGSGQATLVVKGNVGPIEIVAE